MKSTSPKPRRGKWHSSDIKAKTSKNERDKSESSKQIDLPAQRNDQSPKLPSDPIEFPPDVSDCPPIPSRASRPYRPVECEITIKIEPPHSDAKEKALPDKALTSDGLMAKGPAVDAPNQDQLLTNPIPSAIPIPTLSLAKDVADDPAGSGRIDQKQEAAPQHSAAVSKPPLSSGHLAPPPTPRLRPIATRNQHQGQQNRWKKPFYHPSLGNGVTKPPSKDDLQIPKNINNGISNPDNLLTSNHLEESGSSKKRTIRANPKLPHQTAKNKWKKPREEPEFDPVALSLSSNSMNPNIKMLKGVDYSDDGLDDKGNLKHQDHDLADWDGAWAPAPADWADRPHFANDRLIYTVDKWLNISVPADSDRVNVKAGGFLAGTKVSEGGSELMPPLAQPTTLPTQKNKYQSTQTSNMLIKTWSNHVKGRGPRRQGNAIVDQKPVPSKPVNPYPNPPKLDMLIRRVQEADLPAIFDIYQFHVKKTVCAIEQASLGADMKQMRIQLLDIREQRLPYLVACLCLPHSNKQVIIGYGYAEDFIDATTCSRFTVEMAVFVHEKYKRKGVGRSLVDKLLGLLDPEYVERGCCPYVSFSRFDMPGGERIVSKVVIPIFWDTTDDTEIKWIKKWLCSGWWRFEEVGNLKGVALKFNKWVDLLYLQLKTGANVVGYGPRGKDLEEWNQIAHPLD
ncbi:MAG: hypothetical protein M1829_005756 [Trizodia sp. TS-e1964]|nr:MAG: hypothetical protein M1829_005756 [Trizodia sp. TS-e1964]